MNFSGENAQQQGGEIVTQGNDEYTANFDDGANRKMMTEAFYCREVCGAKCCHLHLPEEGAVRCPKLMRDNSCSVYESRYADGMPAIVKIGEYTSRSIVNLDRTPAKRPFYCGRVKSLIQANALPEDVVRQCCVAHPELLITE